jgi:hypothetical protein
MSSITIELPEKKLERLNEVARSFGVSVEELARSSIEELLAQPDDKFQRVAEHILRKNEDLYRRLA